MAHKTKKKKSPLRSAAERKRDLRAAGEAGTLTDRDIAAFKKDPGAFSERLKRFIERKQEAGVLTDKDKKRFKGKKKK